MQAFQLIALLVALNRTVLAKVFIQFLAQCLLQQIHSGAQVFLAQHVEVVAIPPSTVHKSRLSFHATSLETT
jgi:hypothetical protein